MSNMSGRYGCIGACSSPEQHPFRQEESMALTQIRCADWGGKNVAGVRTKHPPTANLKTPISFIVQVLSALTEGVGINAATRLYGVSKNSIYRWQERLSSVKKPCSCLP